MYRNLFGKSQNEPRNVHCQITGKETTLENTVVLVKIDGVIALKNLRNPTVDFENNIIKPIDRPPLNFYSELIVPNDLKKIFGRMFSIVKDEDVIEQSTSIMSVEGQRNFSGRNLLPFVENISNGVELINLTGNQFIAVIDTVAHAKTKNCENWIINYKGLGAKYFYKAIIDEKIEKHVFGSPGVLLPWYDVSVSDCAQKNPNGTSYMYKTDGQFKAIDLCCNESAVSFCKKNKALVYYNDFLNQGKLRVLSPKTVSINENLQNSYLYRSSNMTLNI
jgi:hypothetical protein